MAIAELPLADTLARPLRDLRISVTDRCQFRCTYCMPREVFGRDFAFLPRGRLLTFEELTRLARVFAGLGVAKLRLTGGEPLLRRDLEKLVAMLAGLGGIQDIALTTNGALLAGKARALAAAGLRRVTVSLDSLDDSVFIALNDAEFPAGRVLDAITAAAGAGLAPVKVNMVVRRGVNEQSILPMAAHFRHSGHVLRFIEYMDVGTTNGWRLEQVVPAAEIISLIGGQWPAPTASSTPACSPGPGTTCAARCARAPVTRRCASRSAPPGRGGPTVTPSSAPARPAARSRCSRRWRYRASAANTPPSQQTRPARANPPGA